MKRVSELNQLKEQLRKLRIELFMELKSLINIYTFDKKLKAVINQPYLVPSPHYSYPFAKYICCPAKMDNIVKEALVRLHKDQNIDADVTWINFSQVAITHQRLGAWLNDCVLKSALQNHIDNATHVLGHARDKVRLFKYRLN